VDEGAIALHLMFVSHENAAEAEEPRIRALNDPAMAIAPELPAVLPAPTPGPEMWHNQIDAAAMESFPERPAIIAAVGDEPRGLHARTPRPATRDGDLGERALEELTLGHRGSFQENSER